MLVVVVVPQKFDHPLLQVRSLPASLQLLGCAQKYISFDLLLLVIIVVVVVIVVVIVVVAEVVRTSLAALAGALTPGFAYIARMRELARRDDAREASSSSSALK